MSVAEPTVIEQDAEEIKYCRISRDLFKHILDKKDVKPLSTSINSPIEKQLTDEDIGILTQEFALQEYLGKNIIVNEKILTLNQDNQKAKSNTFPVLTESTESISYKVNDSTDDESDKSNEILDNSDIVLIDESEDNVSNAQVQIENAPLQAYTEGLSQEETFSFSYLLADAELKDEYKHISDADLARLISYLQSKPQDLFPLQFVPKLAEHLMSVESVDIQIFVTELLNPKTEGGRMSGGVFKELGQGGFGIAFTVYDRSDLITRYKGNFREETGTKMKLRIHTKPGFEKVNYTNLVLKELKFNREAEKEITNIGIVEQCVRDTYGIDKGEGKEILRKLNYHSLSDKEKIPEQVLRHYTPIHPYIQKIEIVSPLGKVYKTLVPLVKRDMDLNGKWLDEDLMNKCYKSCLIILYALHTHGYYHFDIKPDNIFWQQGKGEGRTIFNLADYGLIGKVYTGAGTPTFISPYNKDDFLIYAKYRPKIITEYNSQLLNKGYDLQQHDLYALGLSLYELQKDKTAGDKVKRLIGIEKHFASTAAAIEALSPPPKPLPPTPPPPTPPVQPSPPENVQKPQPSPTPPPKPSVPLKVPTSPQSPTTSSPKKTEFKTLFDSSSFNENGKQSLGKFNNICTSFNPQSLSDKEKAYEFFLDFFSIYSNLKGPHTPWMKLTGNAGTREEDPLVTSFKDIFSKNEGGLPLKITNEICIFIDLCQIYVRLERQKSLVIDETSNKVAMRALLRRSEIKALFKKVYDDANYKDYPIVRFTGAKYQTSLDQFKTGLISFGGAIIEQLKEPTKQQATPNTDETWLRDMYIVSALNTEKDEDTKLVFKREFIVNIISTYNKFLSLEESVVPSIPTDFTPLNPSLPTNPLVLAIYTRTYKLILADYLRMYMLNAILYKCAVTGCMEGYGDQEKGKYLDKLINILGRIKETHTRFVTMLNAEDTDKVMFDIKSYFRGRYEEIEDILKKYNKPLVLKYSSLAEKMLTFLSDKKGSEKVETLICDHIQSIAKLDIYSDDLKRGYDSVYTELFENNITDFTSSPVTPPRNFETKDNLPSCRTNNEIWGKLVNLLNTLRRPILVKSRLFVNPDLLKEFIKYLVEKKPTFGDIQDSSLIEKFIQNEDNYTKLVDFFENISGAVRVFIKIRDDYIIKEGGYDNNKAIVEYKEEGRGWQYNQLGIKSSNGFIELTKNGIYQRYGPFFSVIPPYHKVITDFERMNNKIVAEEYLRMNQMMQLLINSKNQNLVLFTYGYSGSGKTYTLFGKIDGNGKGQPDNDKGAVFRFIENVLKRNIEMRSRYSKRIAEAVSGQPLSQRYIQIQLESVSVLYGSLGIQKLTNDYTPVVDPSNKLLVQLNGYLRSDDIGNSNQTLMKLVYEITEKNNKQGVYDRIVKAITKYVRAGEAGWGVFETEFAKIKTDFGVLESNTAPGGLNWLTYIKSNNLYSKEAIYKELFPPSQGASTLYVKSTPNNPNSSRGFLFFTFNVNGNKMVIVDMAGNEDPYDIMIKTIPTYKLPFGKELSFLKSKDVSKNDMIVGMVKTKMTGIITDIFQQMYPAIVYGFTASTDEVFVNKLYGNNKDFKLQEFNPDKATVFALINNNSKLKLDTVKKHVKDRYSKHYDFKNIKFMGNFFKLNTNFETIIDKLNYNIYDFIITFYQNLITCACENISNYKKYFVKPNVNVFDNLQVEVEKYGSTLSPENKRDKAMFDNVIKASQLMKLSIQKNLNVGEDNILFSSLYKSDDKSVDIKLYSNDICLSVLSVYYLCTEKINGFNDGVYDGIEKSNFFKEEDYKELNEFPVNNVKTKEIILQKIEKIGFTIDVLYFEHFKLSKGMIEYTTRQSKIKDTIENLSYIKYVLQFIITSPLFVEHFTLTGSMLTKDENTIVSNIKFNNNLQSPFTIHNDKANEKTIEAVLKSNIQLDDAFKNQRIPIVKLEDKYEDIKELHDKYSIIESSRDYFTTIIKEGFYINQVNYELVEFLKSRLDGKGTNSYNEVKERALTDLTILLSNAYNPNQHLIQGTTTSACTNILYALNEILNLTDKTKNNKFFMIANIRPDITKFRQGALNTLELVQELKST